METVTIGTGDDWTCVCGNTVIDSGFDTCLENGELIEPLIGSDWNGHYRCMGCARIIFDRDGEGVVIGTAAGID